MSRVGRFGVVVVIGAIGCGGSTALLMSISIPPTGQPATVSGSCNVSQDMNLISKGAHMHQRATHFVATSGNTTLYQTDVWSDPPTMPYSPPLLLKRGFIPFRT